MESRYGSLLEATDRISTKQDVPREGAEVLPLRQVESRRIRPLGLCKQEVAGSRPAGSIPSVHSSITDRLT
jgi:hypothetical protein